MKVFDHPNMNGFKCPICGTSEDKPVVLIGIEGTEEGFNQQARQYHPDCIDLVEAASYATGERVLYQFFDGEDV